MHKENNYGINVRKGQINDIVVQNRKNWVQGTDNILEGLYEHIMKCEGYQYDLSFS